MANRLNDERLIPGGSNDADALLADTEIGRAVTCMSHVKIQQNFPPFPPGFYIIFSVKIFSYCFRNAYTPHYRVLTTNLQVNSLLDLLSLPYPRLPELAFPRLVPTVFSSYSACIPILIDYFHLSCLVSTLLSTGYGPRPLLN